MPAVNALVRPSPNPNSDPPKPLPCFAPILTLTPTPTLTQVELTEPPWLVVALNDIEVAHFERVVYGLKNFDLVLVLKDFSQKPLQINSINMVSQAAPNPNPHRSPSPPPSPYPYP